MTSNRMEKEMEGWRRKSDAYYNDFMWHSFSMTPSTFSKKNYSNSLTCTLEASITSVQTKSSTWASLINDKGFQPMANSWEFYIFGWSVRRTTPSVTIWPFQSYQLSKKQAVIPSRTPQMHRKTREIKEMANNTERREEEIHQTASRLSDERVG